MKITIIMPLYNEEQEVKKSITSIINQTYQNFELILINDGSTDNSEAVCQAYAEHYENIRLFTIENSGPGFARNFGMTHARGDYLAFVDADDYLAPDFLEHMTQIMEAGDFDIVASHHYLVDQKIKVAPINYTQGIVDKQGTPEQKKRYEQFKVASSFGYVWGKLYKKSFIQEKEIRFSEERAVFLEDTLFNLKLFAYQPRYYLYDLPLYYYHFYEGSLSNKKKDVTLAAIRFLEDYYDFLIERNHYEDNLDLLIPLANRVLAWSLFKTLENDFQLKNIRQKIKLFAQNQTVQKIVQEPQALKELAKLESRLQIIMYSWITWNLRYGFEEILAVFFCLNYPLFKIYIQNSLRA